MRIIRGFDIIDPTSWLCTSYCPAIVDGVVAYRDNSHISVDMSLSLISRLRASLLFAIGPLAILGSISDGMSTGIDQLLLKSTLDFFAAMAFATSLGWGVAVSALPVGIYQGVWTVIGLALGKVLDGYQVDAMTVVGGIMLLCIALRLLKIKSVAVGNLLPALAIAPLLALAMHQFI